MMFRSAAAGIAGMALGAAATLAKSRVRHIQLRAAMRTLNGSHRESTHVGGA